MSQHDFNSKQPATLGTPPISLVCLSARPWTGHPVSYSVCQPISGTGSWPVTPTSLLQNIISNNFPVNSSVAVQSPDFLSDDFEQVWSDYRNRDHTLYAQGKKQVTSRFVFVILYSDLPKKTLKLLGNNLDTDIFSLLYWSYLPFLNSCSSSWVIVCF